MGCPPKWSPKVLASPPKFLETPDLNLLILMTYYFVSASNVSADNLPNTTVSTTALPPKRLAPWIPPVITPAAYNP